MKRFDLLMDHDMFSHCMVYRISRSSNAYSYLTCEYTCLDRNDDGSILLPANVPVEEKPPRIFRMFHRKDHSIRIPAASGQQSYFRSEYSHSFAEDLDHNLIIPEDEYPRGKFR